MADKIVQVTALDQSDLSPTGSYFTLPSPSGEMTQTLEEADTTIFGTGSFSTGIPTIASFTGSFSTWLRNIAGYNATIKRDGTPAPTSGEPLSAVGGSTTVFQIADIDRQLIDTTASIKVYEGASEVAASEYTIEPLFGIVTFDTARTDSITMDYTYIPLETFGRSNSVSLTQSADTTDTTTFQSAARDNGYSQFEYSLLSVEGSLDGFYDVADDFFSILNSREQFTLEINWDGDGSTGNSVSNSLRSRMTVTLSEQGLSGDVGQPEEQSLSFVLSSKSEEYVPYSFDFGASTQASDAFQLVMNSWLNREYIGFRYAPDGLNEDYYEGAACVSDASLENSVSEIPEMSIELQGTRELSKVII